MSVVAFNQRSSCIKAILFDLGDTVLKERSYNLASGYAAISKYLAPDASLEKLMEATALSQKGNREFKLLDWISCNLSNSNAAKNELEIELELWNNTVSLVPISGVREVFDFLSEKNIRIAAISNATFSSHCMKAELARHDLDKYFEFVISSADYGIRKPDTTIFELGLSRLGIKSQDAWFIGDKWDADVIGAVSANINAVWFSQESQGSDADIEHIKLHNWSEFEEVYRKNT